MSEPGEPRGGGEQAGRGQHGGRDEQGGRDQDSGLERRYRRLLAWYPAPHRRAHGQEMLDVLMTGARPGQHRPGTAVSADLIWGAVRIRVRPRRDWTADPGWREALALLSVVLPLLVLTETVAALAFYRTEGIHFSPVAVAIGLVLQGQLAVVILVLLRLRRAAAVVAAGTLGWLIVGAALNGVDRSAISGSWFFPTAALVCYLLLLGLEAVALGASPGPRRGLQLLSPRRCLVLVVAGVAVGAAEVSWSGNGGGWDVIPRTAITGAAIAVLAMITIWLALASRTSCRLLLLLAAPAYSLTLPLATAEMRVSLAAVALALLPPMVILSLAAVLAARRGGAGRPAG